ncbi:Uncharacterised protein [Yersinia kristensenii]|nr:Uncharacterised protein [Yersinia kristensenii]
MISSISASGLAFQRRKASRFWRICVSCGGLNIHIWRTCRTGNLYFLPLRLVSACSTGASLNRLTASLKSCAVSNNSKSARMRAISSCAFLISSCAFLTSSDCLFSSCLIGKVLREEIGFIVIMWHCDNVQLGRVFTKS